MYAHDMYTSFCFVKEQVIIRFALDIKSRLLCYNALDEPVGSK